ncbi:hypothetical protein B4U80_08333 [Leptotrombidium deliense]|uniref:Uncharacterized protein n=1 Tax=Leptotrombidium deliense TaxID=299467 RepID=A0A443ST19_9ACAR|nr:hypothetical protein B4U80_08333 [Leptotrombidium deliense]
MSLRQTLDFDRSRCLGSRLRPTKRSRRLRQRCSLQLMDQKCN